MSNITIKQFCDMSNEVWIMFKKCFSEDGSPEEFITTATKIGNKYRADEDKYKFVVELMRTYIHALNMIKGESDD